MKRRLQRGTLIFGLLVLVSACSVDVGIGGVRGNGDVETESREIAPFSAVVLEGSGSVTIEMADFEGLTVEAESNLLPILTSEVINGELVLSASESISPTTEINYRISGPLLEGVVVKGSGNIRVLGASSDNFVATALGSGSISVENLSTGSTEVSIEGSGGVTLAGFSSTLNLSVAGSGSYFGEDLVSETCVVEIAGSGSAVVSVTERLDATVSGSGSVTYFGSPIVETDITGSGSVTAP